MAASQLLAEKTRKRRNDDGVQARKCVILAVNTAQKMVKLIIRNELSHKMSAGFSDTACLQRNTIKREMQCEFTMKDQDKNKIQTD